MKPQKNACAVARLLCTSAQHKAEALERRVLLDGAPQLVKVWFDYAHAPQTINFQFDQDVSASLEAAKAPLVLDNLTTGEEFNDSTDPDPDQAWGSNGDYTQNMTWDPSTDTATFSFPNYNGGTVGVNGVLDDGWYAATLSPQDVQNSAGIALAAPATYQFEYLNGDIAGAFDSDGNSIPDGVINRQDVAAFAVGYNHLYDGPTGYLDGDLNYDGVINRLDVSQFSQDYLFEGQLAPPPTSPGQLVLNPASTSEIDLAWPQVPNGTLSDGNPYTVTGYRIERSDDGENFYELATVDPNNLNSSIESFSNSTFYYHDVGLGDGQREWYRVRALIQYSNDNDGTTSPYSAYTPKQSTVTTLLGPISVNLTAISPTDVQLSFEAGTANATNFEIDRSGDGGSTWAPITFEPAPSNEQADSSVTYDDTSADPGTDYEYRVIAKNASTNSAPSAPSDISTPMPTVAISGASTVEQNATYDLALSDPSPSVGTVTGWDIYWGDNGDTPEHWDGDIGSATHVYDNYNTDNTIIAYADVTLPDGTTATFASNTVDVTTTPAPPGMPTGFTAVALQTGTSEHGVDLGWSLATDSDVTSETVEWSTDGGNTYPYSSTLEGSETTFDTEVPELIQQLTFKVQANNSTGNSSFSTPVTVNFPTESTTSLNPLATAGTNGITISWTPLAGAAGYEIYRVPNAYDTLGVSFTVSASSAPQYIDTTVLPGVGYEYSIFAYDSTGSIIPGTSGSIDTTALGMAPFVPATIFLSGTNYFLTSSGDANAIIDVDASDIFSSGVPDYAVNPPEVPPGDNPTGMARLNISFNGFPDGQTAAAFSINYTIPTSPGQTPNSLPGGYFDYSTSQANGFIRIWQETLDPTTDKYQFQSVNPGPIQQDGIYWVQGIKTGTDTISLSVDGGGADVYTTSTTVTVVDAEALLNVTNSGNIATEPTTNGSGQSLHINDPDPSFQFNANDELLKDQQGGFNFWWSQNTAPVNSNSSAFINTAALGSADLSDLFPIQLQLPQQYRQPGWTYTVSLNVSSLPSNDWPYVNFRVYPSASNTNPLAYVSSTAGETAQLQEPCLNFSNPTYTAPTYLLGRFMWTGSSPPPTISCDLFLVIRSPLDFESISTSKITIRPIRDYWSLWSARTPETGSQAQALIPIDPGNGGYANPNNYALINTYAPATYVASPDDPSTLPWQMTPSTTADPTRQVLVFVHGYNISESDAVGEGDTLYQRLYWAGYRGRLVLYDWQGDDGGTLNFNTDVRHAFETAPTFINFLQGPVSQWTGNTAADVDVMAHSLGNLVAWEAMREASALQLPKLFKNLLSVEAAIPEEAFQPLAPLSYTTTPTNGYVANTGGDVQTYQVSQLMEMSWLGWFDQPGDYPLNAISGSAYNSYDPTDTVLSYIYRVNDQVTHGGLWWSQDHYYRSKISAGHPNRTFDENAGSDDSIWNMPLLMSRRQTFYLHNNLNVAQGMTSNPLLTVNPITRKNPNVDADDLSGYPAGQHSALFGATMGALWTWYSTFVEGNL